MLDVSEQGLAFVAAREACVLTAYQDSRHLAIGFGVNDANLKDGTTISFDEATARYVAVVPSYHRSIEKAFAGILLPQNQVDALFSATWNIGGTRLQEEANLIRAVRAFNAKPTDKTLRDRAAYELMHVRWDLNGYKPFNLSRRCLEAILFIKGDYGNVSELTLWREGKKPGIDLPETVPMPTFKKAA